MKICLVSREYPPETGWGGIGTYVYNLAHGLSNLGHEVHIISFAPCKETEYLDKEVRVHRIKAIKLRLIWRIGRYFPIYLLSYGARVARKLDDIIKAHQIDIIEFSNFEGEGLWFLLFRNNKIPVVTRMHTPLFEVLEIEHKSLNVCNRIKCWIEKTAVLKSDFLVCSTVAHAKMMANMYKIDLNKIRIVPLGIDESIEGSKGDIKMADKSFNILYISRLEKRKGIDTLLVAIPHLLRKYPEINFYIIGNDPDNKYKTAFEQMHGTRLPSSVHFLGFLESAEIETYLKNCDLFVVPSLYESFGLVFLEAMKYGKPVVACKAGGIPEVVADGETGILIPPNDVNALKSAIAQLVEDRAILSRLGVNGLARFKEFFTLKRMALKTDELYRSLIS